MGYDSGSVIGADVAGDNGIIIGGVQVGHSGEIAVYGAVEGESRYGGFDSQEFRELLAWCGDMGHGVPEGSNIAPYDASEVVLMYEPIQRISIEVSGKRYLSRMERLTGEPACLSDFRTETAVSATIRTGALRWRSPPEAGIRRAPGRLSGNVSRRSI